jgi:hypothetical protein
MNQIIQMDLFGKAHYMGPRLGLAPLVVYTRMRNEMRHGVMQSLNRLACMHGQEYHSLWRHAKRIEQHGLISCVRVRGMSNTYVTNEVKEKTVDTNFKFNQCVGLKDDPAFVGFIGGAMKNDTGPITHVLVVIRNGGESYPSKSVKPIPVERLQPRDERPSAKSTAP